MTRRLTTSSSSSPSFWKIAPTLSDGALRQDERSRDARVALALGHLGSTSLARGQFVERDRWRGRSAASTVDEPWINGRAAPCNDLDRGDQLRPIEAVLQDVTASGGLVLEQAQGVSAPAYWLQDDDTDVRGVRRTSRAIRMPSSSPPGGIRMSVMITSGAFVSSAARRLSPSANVAKLDLVDWRKISRGLRGSGTNRRPGRRGLARRSGGSPWASHGRAPALSPRMPAGRCLDDRSPAPTAAPRALRRS